MVKIIAAKASRVLEMATYMDPLKTLLTSVDCASSGKSRFGNSSLIAWKSF